MTVKNTHQEFLIIDVGNAWTKGFLVNLNTSSETVIKIEDKTALPTSINQLDLCLNLITKKIKKKNLPVILSGKLEGLGKFAKENKYYFIDPQVNEVTINHFFGEAALVFDAAATYYQSISKLAEIDQINSFLTTPTSHIETENYLANKKTSPYILPDNDLQLQIEEGFFRLILQKKLKENIGALILTGGILSNHPRISSLILLVLDSIKDQILQVYLDKEQFIPSLATLLTFLKIHTFVQIVPPLINLGAVAALGGVRQVFFSANGQLGEKAIEEGKIILISLKEGTDLKLEFKKENKKIVASLNSGVEGLFLDARKKPIDLETSTILENLKWRKFLEERK